MERLSERKISKIVQLKFPESFKAVLIPIEVGLLTAIVPLLNFATCEPQLYLSLYILVIGAIFSACCFFFTSYITEMKIEIDFLNDAMEILFAEENKDISA